MPVVLSLTEIVRFQHYIVKNLLFNLQILISVKQLLKMYMHAVYVYIIFRDGLRRSIA